MATPYNLIGILPAPRVLFVFKTEHYQGAADRSRTALSDVIPTAEVVSWTDLRHVDISRYDLTVMFGGYMPISVPMRIVLFGGSALGDVWTGTADPPSYELHRTDSTVATRWSIPPEATVEEQELVAQDLLPLVPRGDRKPEGYIGYTPVLHLDHPKLPAKPWPAIPKRRLLVDANGAVFAIAFATREGHWRWVLPDGANPVRWLRFILAHLNGHDAAKFPLLSSWADTPAYQTPDETDAKASLASIASERARLLAELDAREAVERERLATAKEAAERGIRALVTTQGDDELKPAVQTALKMLGFIVADSDITAPKGQRLEDLQVRISEDEPPSEVALVEVKGYTTGAKVNDLQKIARYVLLYTTRHGVVPARRWYIVNELIGRPPSDRKGLLLSNDEDVATFAEDGGLILATEELLRLVLKVMRKEMQPAEARDLLWAATGRFSVA